MIEKIKFKNRLYAIIIRAGFKKEGVNFITSKRRSLQVGVLIHKRNNTVKPHIHRKLAKILTNTEEVLYLVSGKIEVSFYNMKKKLGSIILNKGDTIILVSGGHGLKILEKSKIMEVKQGPYVSCQKDKKFINIK